MLTIGKNLVWICLILSSLGLFLVYFASQNSKPLRVRIEDIDPSLIGRVVETSGMILNTYSDRKGNLFLTLADRSKRVKIQVPLFANFLDFLPYPRKAFKKYKWIEIRGVVSEYRGILQIIPRKLNDVKLGGWN